MKDITISPISYNRTVEESKDQLKTIQKRLCRLLSRIKTPEWRLSKKGVSYCDNAKFHLKNNHFCCVDIAKFYPSCKIISVFYFFKFQLEMPEDVAWLISKIVTYNDHLPTGAPSSPIIAYWAYSNVFHSIHRSAEKLGLKMSLYVDDMTFSSDRQIPKNFIKLVEKRLAKVNLPINSEKTEFFYPKDYKKITGCCITPNNEIKVPNNLSQKIELEKKGQKIEDLQKGTISRLFGLYNAARQIEPNYQDTAYVRLKNLLSQKSI